MIFRKMKLAAKTSLITAIVLIVSLTTLIGLSVFSASRAVTAAIDGEFSGIATQNGLIVQGIVDDAASTAQDLQDYLQVHMRNMTKCSQHKQLTRMVRRYLFPPKEAVFMVWI